MKKYIAVFAILAVAIVAAIAFAGETAMLPRNTNGATPYVQMWTLSTAQTTTGASTSTYNFGMPMSNFTCETIFTGVTPTNITNSIDGSMDGTNWSQLATSLTVSTTSGAVFNATGTAVQYLRNNIVSLNTSSSGYSGATTKCNAKQ